VIGDGNWTTKSDWTPNGDPAAGDSALLSAAGTYTVTISTDVSAGAVSISDAGATLVDGGLLALTGGASKLTVADGTFQLKSAGSVVGGAIVAGKNGAFLWAGGTLAGVTFDGTLSLAGGSLRIENGITLHAAGGTGAGKINATGDGATLTLPGAESLNGATVSLGSSVAAEAAAIKGDAMTFGAQLTIAQAGRYAEITASSSLHTQSAIDLSESAGHFTLKSAGLFDNAGSVAVSNGDDAQLRVGEGVNTAGGAISVTGAGSSLLLSSTANLSNAGMISAASDGRLTIDANVANTSQISVAGGGGLTINGSLTGSNGEVLLSADASVRLNGAVSSGQSVLFLDATGDLSIVLSSPTSFAGFIVGMSTISGSVHDTVDLVGVQATKITSTATSQSAELVIKNGTQVVADLELLGNYVGATFQVASDLHGGADITIKPSTSARLAHFTQTAAAFGDPKGGIDWRSISTAAPVTLGLQLGVRHALDNGWR
jgi:hypothetical protein